MTGRLMECGITNVVSGIAPLLLGVGVCHDQEVSVTPLDDMYVYVRENRSLERWMDEVE